MLHSLLQPSKCPPPLATATVIRNSLGILFCWQRFLTAFHVTLWIAIRRVHRWLLNGITSIPKGALVFQTIISKNTCWNLMFRLCLISAWKQILIIEAHFSCLLRANISSPAEVTSSISWSWIKNSVYKTCEFPTVDQVGLNPSFSFLFPGLFWFALWEIEHLIQFNVFVVWVC